MIIDEKVIMYPPPPPYLPGSLRYGGSTPSLGRTSLTLTALPPHILLQIIHHTFPQGVAAVPTPLNSTSYRYDNHRLYEDTTPERQRKTLFWLSTSLRLVSRTLYTACMHILRSTYLPAYQTLIRPSYSSDPFPMAVPFSTTTSSSASITSSPPAYESPSSPTTPTPTSYSPLITPHRETAVLDRFILLKVRQDVFQDDTCLHTDREDAFRDIFDVAQPRARLEDLVRIIGAREGVVYVPGWGTGTSSSPRNSPNPQQSSFTHVTTTTPMTFTPSPQSQSQTPTPKRRQRSFFSFFSSSSSAHSSSSERSIPSTFPPRVPPQPQPIPFPALSVSFSPRRVGLIMNRSRTVAEVARTGASGYGGRGRESLEELAARLVGGLREWSVEVDR